MRILNHLVDYRDGEAALGCFEPRADCTQKSLLTDDRPEQLQFYASLGFKNTRDLVETRLNAFVIIEGIDIT